ncbi:metallophosphoesterase [Clostridium massiliodielmoense]|uniref:metallophosphoesterase n=1 Tax=Clostridium massiliodielmoense TaxID=1776385 RepID=UPI000A271546|nr:metallophosphoesterase [Clostridium massiliodielmoense]
MKLSRKRNFKSILSCIVTLVMLVTICPVTFAISNDKSSLNNSKNSGIFLNGPYLLAPKENSMTIVWETDTPMNAWLFYGKNNSFNNKIKVKCEPGIAFKGKKMCMYRATLKNLTPDTLYKYKVQLDSGITENGSFKTLSVNPNKTNFLVISDTHKFETAKDFEEIVSKTKPDFILHTGDLVEGTGLQKDQFSFWLKGGSKFVKNIPVIHAMGNHDNGPYYDEYFSKVQQKEYSSDTTGRNISFNYGNVHFIMMDSCPWGLYEMNAITSGGKVDEKTKKTINDSINWLVNDLNSAEAKKANFRIIGMHHPYLDDFTQKNLVEVLEKYNVNLMFGGHFHEYYRNFSSNPRRGAKTVYITQGDGRIPDGKIDFGKDNQRLDENFPEVVAKGKSDFISVSVNGDKLIYDNYGFTKNNKEEIIENLTLSSKEPNLALSNVSITPNNIKSNEVVKVTATVKNEGEGLAAAVLNILDNNKEIPLYLFGEKGKERVISLNPGESKTLTSEIPLSKVGTHIVSLGDYKTTVEVNSRPATFEYTNMKTRIGTGKQSNILYIKSDIRNTGNEKGIANAKLYIDDTVVSSKEINLEALQKKTIDFSYKFDRHGSYNVRIDNQIPEKIDIEGIIKGTPIVKDLSGKENHGILRGGPKLIKSNSGIGVALDGIDDYIEIPDSKDFRVYNGLTGIVSANIDRLATADEWDHNPLLIKGPSISYGVNYLYRMALRRTGKFTYGVGFNNDNGEFFWNDGDKGGAQLGKWCQYTGTFDKKTGGVSYLDDIKTGEIDPPQYDSPIKNWEGSPIFCGYSYHKHLLKNRGRGKYYTLLNGKIDQIRFYTTKLTTEENKYILEHPNEKGPQSDKLAVWLNFKDIQTKGTHQTEWRRPGEFNPTFKRDKELWNFKTLTVNCNVPGTSSLNATIEVSDDGENVKSSKKIALEDGNQLINISDLPKAQFIRIRTEFNSVMSFDNTYIPQLNEYSVHAYTDNYYTNTIWSTRADWEKGVFKDAAGFEPNDRFKNYEKDLNNY